MFAHSYSTKLSRTCYGGKTPYTLLNSSVFRWRQKQDADEDKSRTATGREFQAAGPQTVKLRDPQRDSRERGIIRSPREDERRRVRVVVADTGVHK